MALRFLAGVALVAGAVTFLVRRYRRPLESGATAIAAEAAAQPVVHADPAPTRPRSAPTPTSRTEVLDSGDAVI